MEINPMRKQSSRQVVIRDTVIGAEKVLICLPLSAKRKSELLARAGEIIKLGPDLIEWRVDCFEHAREMDKCLLVLRELRKKIGSIPLIFTCRSELEGGQNTMSGPERLELVTGAISTGDVDIADIEMSSGAGFIDRVKEVGEESLCKLILSYHNFDRTPAEEFVVEKLVQAEKMGGDIAKVAVMPQNSGDVLTLLSATCRARTGLVKIPMITMSMGAVGAISRLGGGVFGSDITFATGIDATAPGQLPIGDVRKVMDILD